jgi:glycolate oxidase
MNSAEVLAALAAALPSEALIVDRDVTQSLSHDEAEWAPVGEPLALIRAASSDQVATTVRICASFGVPVPPVVLAMVCPAALTPLTTA